MCETLKKLHVRSARDSTTSGGSRNRGGYWRGFRGVTRGEGGGGGGREREERVVSYPDPNYRYAAADG